MKVAIQGEPGSFSDEAAATFLPRARVVPCATSYDAFDTLASGRADAALLPVENSLAGPVAINLDLLLARETWIEREFRLRIRHYLIAAPGVREREVRRVLSHPVALEQCRELFRAHPQLRPEPFYDTAGSVKHVIESGARDTAAIAGRRAATTFGGKILRASIEDDHRNYTRFFLVRRRAPREGGLGGRVVRGANKTSIAFVLHNEPGALFKALAVFAVRDIDLSKIESRPLRGRPWEYVFFADYLRGDDEPSRRARSHLAEISEFVKVLGIYARAEGASNI